MSTIRTNTILDSSGGNTATINGIPLRPGVLDPDNRIINGAFDIWQRGTSTSASAYGADRWLNIFVGGTVTQSRESFALGDTLGSNNPKYFLRQSVSGQSLATHFAGTTQRIEGAATYAGQTITILGWARRFSGAGNILVAVAQNFGTGGSPSATTYATISSSTITLSATWQPFAITFTMPSVAGKTLGTDSNDYVEFSFYPSLGTSYGGTGVQTIAADMWGIHIKLGTHAADSADLYKAPELGPELVRCLRYCRSGNVYGWGNVGGGGITRAAVERFGIPMRKTPSITFSGQGYGNASALATDGIQPTGFGAAVNVTAAGSYIVNANYIADAEL